nr:reverse transcriptase domain-containing protein [Tanacetum cinerariifolium]
MARSVDCSFVNTIDTRFRDTERRIMTALETVNMRVSYQVDVCSRESLEFYSRHHDAQKDRAAVRAEIEVLRRERLAYEQESIQIRKALARSEAYSKTLEARVKVLETQARRHEWQRQTADDFAALINRGVAAAMAEAKASRVRNGYDSNGSGPRLAQAVRVALTWWNSHVKTITLEVAHALLWKTLKKMMTDKYCPRGEIKKLETEMWELKSKDTDVIGYSRRFQELALMCDRMFPEESNRVEKYIGGLPDTIHYSVKATRPKTMQEAIEFATELMDK